MRLYHSCCKVISTAVCSQASASVSQIFYSALKKLETNPLCRKIPGVEKSLCQWNLQLCGVLKTVLTENV